MNFAKGIVLFLLINFGGLALGGWLMDSGPQSDWYVNLNQAPWTPPGWAFGFAWTTIMILFSIYLAKLFVQKPEKHILGLYAFQLFLNVIWNYVFFNQQLLDLGLVVILSLLVVICIFFFRYKKPPMQNFRWLLLPYMVWLVVASSLNGYIALYN